MQENASNLYIIEYFKNLYILGSIDKYVKTLEDKFKHETLRNVYAGINGKSVDDPDMQAFFKMKFWS